MTTSTHPVPRAATAVVRVAVLVVVETAGLAAALRLGRSPESRPIWSDLELWIATSTAMDVTVGLLRPVVLALTGYLLATTALYLVALLLHAPRAVARLGAVTPRWVRAATERAVAVGLLATTWAAPAAHAAGTDPVPPPGLRVPSSSSFDVRAPALVLPQAPRPGTPDPTPAVAPARTVTVVPGDHLWSIAVRALAVAHGSTVDGLADGSIADYWRDLVAANEAHLRSGDPDLIHPGEVVRLPDPT